MIQATLLELRRQQLLRRVRACLELVRGLKLEASLRDWSQR
jgi:hypothetical protein